MQQSDWSDQFIWKYRADSKINKKKKIKNKNNYIMNRWQKIFVTHLVCKSIKSGSLEPKHRNEEGLEAFAQQRITKKLNCLKNK